MEKQQSEHLLINLAHFFFTFALEDSVIVHNICDKHLEFAEELNPSQWQKFILHCGMVIMSAKHTFPLSLQDEKVISKLQFVPCDPVLKYCEQSSPEE